MKNRIADFLHIMLNIFFFILLLPALLLFSLLIIFDLCLNWIKDNRTKNKGYEKSEL